ncbi:cytochrome b [Isoptericola jiangsuensis]|uniref:cytochrome b n=1 Tax=Bacteria TaxID=2 RepID=UPI00190D506B|nr:cytochrome b [Stenotrophomonas sp. S41]MBK0011698.1 cytochrome b [Stenotrophomonas sp. S41]
MKIKNDKKNYGATSKFFHWTSAASFIGAYLVVYYVIWFMDDTQPESMPVLNVHWALGLIVGSLVIPRLLWRWLNVEPEAPESSAAEHVLAQCAHYGLYALMILMPLTGYVGTGAPTDFGLFSVTAFNETRLFAWFSSATGITWEAFEPPVDAVHHFVGKWVAWVVVGLHVIAALMHHFVRRDNVLVRMMPGNWQK